jgi:hypothetical protein
MNDDMRHALHTIRNVLIGLKGLTKKEQLTVYKLLFGWRRQNCSILDRETYVFTDIDDETFEKMVPRLGQDLIECIEYLLRSAFPD